MTTKHKSKSAEDDPQPGTQGIAISLSPSSAVFGSAPFTLRVIGGLFTPTSGITFAGGSKVTTYVNANEVTCLVDWSVITGPGVVPVWVVTDGVSTNPADFTVTAANPPPSDANAITPNATLTMQLRSLGIMGTPVRWAFDQYQAPVTAIRAANTGYGTVASAQGVLDSSFPFNQLDASKICVSLPSTLKVTAKTKDGKTSLLVDKIAALDLPPENVTWYVDGNIVAHGTDVSVDQLSPGEHDVICEVAVAGVVHSQRETIGEPLVAQPVDV